MKFVFVLLLNLYLIFQSTSAEQQIGDDCTTLENNPGKCLLLSNCPTAIKALQNGNHPQHCGFLKLEPIICCETSGALTHSVSEQKCISYAAFGPDLPPIVVTHVGFHGPPVIIRTETEPTAETETAPTAETGTERRDVLIIPIVVGGEDAKAKEFPHIASLGFTKGNEKLWRCGGSLISEQYVLTAAHCLQSRDLGLIEWVRLGEQNLPSDTGVEFINDYKVIERIAHPGYKAPSSYNDVALLKLDRVVTFTNVVKPACLFTDPDISPKTRLVVTGWGLTQYAGSPSQILQKVELDWFTAQECNETYSNTIGTRKLRYGISAETQICVGGRNAEKDSCQGDSGGPLQTYLVGQRIHSIVGITSFGKSCGLANIPGVYSRVSYYVPWIESVIWPNA